MNDLKAQLEKLGDAAAALKRYLPALFCLLLLCIYGFLVYQVQVLNTREPSSSDVAAQSVTAQVPHIDTNTLDQLKSLQDNSVSVQTLFDTARSNPFQE